MKRNKFFPILLLIGYVCMFVLIAWFTYRCFLYFEPTFFCIAVIIYLILTEIGIINMTIEHIKNDVCWYCPKCKKIVFTYKDDEKNIICNKCNNIIEIYKSPKGDNGHNINDFD